MLLHESTEIVVTTPNLDAGRHVVSVLLVAGLELDGTREIEDGD